MLPHDDPMQRKAAATGTTARSCRSCRVSYSIAGASSKMRMCKGPQRWPRNSSRSRGHALAAAIAKATTRHASLCITWAREADLTCFAQYACRAAPCGDRIARSTIRLTSAAEVSQLGGKLEVTQMNSTLRLHVKSSDPPFPMTLRIPPWPHAQCQHRGQPATRHEG